MKLPGLKDVQGITRPAVTVLFGLTVCGGFWIGRISADQFLPIASTVVLWWFADRSAKRNQQ